MRAAGATGVGWSCAGGRPAGEGASEPGAETSSPAAAGAMSGAAALGAGAAGWAGASAGSSGCTSRRRPSRSAFLRTRSACASSMDDEWLLTPIPRDKQRSSASLLVRPSSWASS